MPYEDPKHKGRSGMQHYCQRAVNVIHFIKRLKKEKIMNTSTDDETTLTDVTQNLSKLGTKGNFLNLHEMLCVVIKH